MDTTRIMLAYVQAVDGINRSDFEPFAALLDENCHWEGAGSTRDEIIAALKGFKEQGWKYHHILSLAAEGDYLTTTARNELTDGSSFFTAGVAQFGPDGKATQIRSFQPPPPATERTSGS